MNHKLISKASSQFGIKEIVGNTHNKEVLKYFQEIGHSWVKDDETAWCSAFVNWVAKQVGANYTGKLNARSWLKIGKKVDVPQIGDVVVFWRQSPTSWKGHVAFFIRETTDLIYVLGGNQQNQVKITAYPKNRLLEYRRL
ncbi:TIGR02594 family protein [Tenacibaculum maritimum]|nr:TIGR02594 family protein [Tenacibaculum maritimum]MDB0603185.1 TIGR02594 family protein [Tenacibaculum maritimum]MDB0610447.1 TIGR02594 family protein [Tenacibaculum maritimum]